MKPIFTLLGAVVVTVGFSACSGKKAGPPPEPPPAEVTVGRAIEREIIEWDEYIGRLAAIDDVALRARVSGYLEATHFKDGQMVEVGDLLFTIDPRPYQAEVDRATAQVAQANASKALASSNLKRAETLLKSNAIAAEEVDIRRGNQLVAAAEVQAAEAELSAAELQLEFTKISAPVAGRISRDLVTPGNLVTGGSAGATLLTTIRSLNPIHCYFEADEAAYLKYMRLDQEGKRPSSRGTPNPVELSLADEESFPHKGTMDFVENAVDRDTDTVQGRAVFDNSDNTLTPGSFARVRLQGSARYAAVQIPDQAIGRDQSQNFVWIIGDDDIARRRTIEPGPMIDGLRVIRDGLKAGERVVIVGLQRLRPDTKVAPTEIPVEPVIRNPTPDQANGAAPTAEQNPVDGQPEIKAKP